VVADEYRTRVAFNARGVRGVDRPYAKPPNASRVVVLGDSFVDGYTVPTEDRLTEIMERNLGPGVEVINLGVVAYSTDQELLMLEQEGWKYQPEIVVLVFYYNDVWQNDQRLFTGNTYKPLFVLGGDGDLVLTHVPVPYPKASLEERFKTYALVRAAIKSHKTLYAVAAGAKVAQGRTRPVPLGDAGNADYFSVFQSEESPEVARAWAVTQALLRKMKLESAQHEATLIVFYAPTRIELSAERWSASHIPDDYDPGHVLKKLLTICAAEDIPCIDPSTEFKAAQRQKPLYFARDPHWNAAGHHLVGEILANSLKDWIAAAKR
jgi:hypothetical protein